MVSSSTMLELVRSTLRIFPIHPQSCAAMSRSPELLGEVPYGLDDVFIARSRREGRGHAHLEEPFFVSRCDDRSPDDHGNIDLLVLHQLEHVGEVVQVLPGVAAQTD